MSSINEKLITHQPHFRRYLHAPIPNLLPQLYKVAIPGSNHHIHQLTLNMCVKDESFRSKINGQTQPSVVYRQKKKRTKKWNIYKDTIVPLINRRAQISLA